MTKMQQRLFLLGVAVFGAAPIALHASSIAAQPAPTPPPLTSPTSPTTVEDTAVEPDFVINGPSTVGGTSGTTPGQADASVDELIALTARLQNPALQRLGATANALRLLADPNARLRFEQEFTVSAANYGLSLLNVGALYSGSIVRGTADVSALIDNHLTASTNINAAIEWELPICKVVGAKGLVGFARDKNGNNNLQGYMEGAACLPLVVSSLELRLGYRFGLRPSAIERGLQIQNEFSGFDGGVTIRAFRLLRERWDLDIYSTNFGLAVNKYLDAAIGSQLSFHTNFSMVSLHRYGKGFGGATQTQDYMRVAIAVEDNLEGTLALAAALDFIRIDSIRFGDNIAVAGSFGLVQESVQTGNSSPPPGTTNEAEGFRWRPGGSLGAKIGDPATFAELKFNATSRVGTLGTAQRELRLTTRLVKQTEKLYFDAQFWLSRARLVTQDGDGDKISNPEAVWGTTVDVVTPVYKALNFYARGEAASVLVPGAAVDEPARTATVYSATGGLTFQLERDFVNHRKPVSNPGWSGTIPSQPSDY
jgi:hypothetical protein